MSPSNRIPARLRRYFWPVPIDREVDEELAAHIEMQTKRFIDGGMTAADARQAALDRFGDVAPVRDECKDIRQHMEDDVRRSEFIDDLQQDFRYAIRTLRKDLGFTMICLLTIAIGIGASTTMFSVVDAVLVQSLPYRHADRTVVLWNSYEQVGLSHAAVSPPEYFDYKEQIPSLDDIAAFRPSSTTITGGAAEPELVSGYTVTPNLFTLLGASAAVGRTFAKDEGSPGGPPVVLLSHGLWMRRFGGDSSVVGREVNVGGLARTVVGVMGADVTFPDVAIGFASARADLWVPNNLEASRTGSRGNQYLAVIGRLREGAGTAQLANDLAAVRSRLRAAFPNRYASISAKKWKVIAVPLRDEMIGSVRPLLFMLSCAVSLLLLIACVNVSNLLLARASLRRGEMAVRLALGASRRRLLRQLLTESTILSLAGGLLGVLVAWFGLHALVQLNPGSIPRLADAHVNGTVLGFSVGVSLLTGVLVGILPALQQSRTSLRSSMGDGARGSSDGKGRRRVRTSLVIAEVALALVVLNCATLFGRSFAALQGVQSGFQSQGVMSMYVTLPLRVYDSSYKFVRFYDRLQVQVAQLPGVTEASGIYPLPMSGEPWSGTFDVEGRPKEDLEMPHAEYAVLLPGYFHALRIPIGAGREFTAADNATAPLVVVIDETLAKQYWPNESAIGKRLNAGSPAGTWATVIGVVRHVHSAGPQTESEPQLYQPFAQNPTPMIYTVARTSVLPASLAPGLRSAVREIDRDLAVSKLRTMDDVVASSVARQRFNLLMIVLFAVVALGLATVGLYGVMSYLVAQRTRDIGIRIAFGGRPSDVRGVVVRESLVIALVGLGLGTLGTLAISRVLATLLFGITPTDPVTYSSVALLLLIVTLAAAWIPARRATRIDPVLALRN